MPSSTLHNLATTAQRRGFSLTEILVVISIIVIVAALAVPAINVLSGARSIDGASNIVSGMLGSARATALARQETVGLAIFTDANRERVGLALVGGPQQWAPNTAYQLGDFIVRDVPLSGGGVETRYYLCNSAHTSLSGDTADEAPVQTDDKKWDRILPGGSGYDAPNTSDTPPRRYPVRSYISILPESDIVYLPPGVAAQVLNSARSTNGTRQTDRYLATGVILFDADGRMAVNRQWGVLAASRLGQLVKFNGGTNIDPGVVSGTPPTVNAGTNTDIATSGLGVILFDRQNYLNQNWNSPWDAQLTASAYGTVVADPDPTPGEEANKEAWLDANGTLLMINRYNGTLLRTE